MEPLNNPTIVVDLAQLDTEEMERLVSQQPVSKDHHLVSW